MHNLTKLAVVVAVIGAGICMAIPFRRVDQSVVDEPSLASVDSEPDVLSPGAERPTDPPRRAEAAALNVAGLPADGSSFGYEGSADPGRSVKSVPKIERSPKKKVGQSHARKRFAEPLKTTPPPDLADTYQRAEEFGTDEAEDNGFGRTDPYSPWPESTSDPWETGSPSTSEDEDHTPSSATDYGERFGYEEPADDTDPADATDEEGAYRDWQRSDDEDRAGDTYSTDAAGDGESSSEDDSYRYGEPPSYGESSNERQSTDETDDRNASRFGESADDWATGGADADRPVSRYGSADESYGSSDEDDDNSYSERSAEAGLPKPGRAWDSGDRVIQEDVTGRETEENRANKRRKPRKRPRDEARPKAGWDSTPGESPHTESRWGGGRTEGATGEPNAEQARPGNESDQPLTTSDAPAHSFSTEPRTQEHQSVWPGATPPVSRPADRSPNEPRRAPALSISAGSASRGGGAAMDSTRQLRLGQPTVIPRVARQDSWRRAGELNGTSPAPSTGVSPPTTNPADLVARAVQPQPSFLRHRVVDGDSLGEIAQRYLGSRNRYLEIFAANRHLLASPDILPIGAELLIPSQPGRVQTPAGAVPAEPHPSGSSAWGPSQPRMVPIPENALPRRYR